MAVEERCGRKRGRPGGGEWAHDGAVRMRVRHTTHDTPLSPRGETIFQGGAQILMVTLQDRTAPGAFAEPGDQAC